MRLAIDVWVGSNKYKAGVSAGWYPGEEWKLINIHILEYYDYDWFDILSISILKFTFSISLTRVTL